MRFYEIEIPQPGGRWSKANEANLHRLKFADWWMRESFQRLLEEYQHLGDLIKQQTKILQELGQTELYRERVKILMSVPGIGLIEAMELRRSCRTWPGSVGRTSWQRTWA